MNLFPAVLVGGPPHRGKSVLTYALSRALRTKGIQHYVLRAAPDGEGDWANESDQDLVRTIRRKSAFSTGFIEHVRRSVAQRHLPLLVDVGGQPTAEQEILFDECTHAILLYGYEAERQEWQLKINRHDLITIAAIRSTSSGIQAVTDDLPIVRGVLSGLERGAWVTGPMIDTLADRVAGLFAYTDAQLARLNLADAPLAEPQVIEYLASLVGVPPDGERYTWEPKHLIPLLALLPMSMPLAVYGRGPAWLYAAMSVHARPAPFWQFDVRLGWTQTPDIRLGAVPEDTPLTVSILPTDLHTLLEFGIPTAYLGYDDAPSLRLPSVPPGRVVILSGKLPNWLYTSLARAYASAPWLAVYQPMLKAAVVVARSIDNAPEIGSTIEVPGFAPRNS